MRNQKNKRRNILKQIKSLRLVDVDENNKNLKHELFYHSGKPYCFVKTYIHNSNRLFKIIEAYIIRMKLFSFVLYCSKIQQFELKNTLNE